MKKLYYDVKKCLGCKSCEIACGVGHSVTGELLSAVREEVLSKPRVKVVSNKGISFPNACRHCDDHPCVDACIASALSYDEKKKIVVHNQERCIGCWMCVMVCPYGAIRPDLKEKIPLRCDRCIDVEEPRCVKACPTGAIIWAEDKELEKILAKKK